MTADDNGVGYCSGTTRLRGPERESINGDRSTFISNELLARLPSHIRTQTLVKGTRWEASLPDQGLHRR